jgi:hypothetical protein
MENRTVDSYVVCETKNDEDEVIRMAKVRGINAQPLVPSDSCGDGIFLNDFP